MSGPAGTSNIFMLSFEGDPVGVGATNGRVTIEHAKYSGRTRP